MRNLTLLIVLAFIGVAYGQDLNFNTQMQTRFNEVDKLYNLDCFYYNPREFKLVIPQTEAYFEGDALKREFKAQTLTDEIDFTFEIFKKDDGVYRVVTFSNGETQSKLIEERFDREFYVRYSETNTDFNKHFEPNTIYCSLDFARDKAFTLTSEKTHIDVHPHNNYDRFYILRKRVNPYYNNDAYNSIILLEDYNVKGASIDLADFITKREVPTLKKSDFKTHLTEATTIPLVVSPAGDNDYTIGSDDLDITYTGGNFNFCMFNNTRNILTSYIRSTHEGRIDFTFDLNEIIAQANGAIDSISLSAIEINLRKTNYLKDLLDKPSESQRYYKKYFKYFKTKFFNQYKAFFKSIKMRISSKHYTEDFTLEGSGTRSIELNFIIQNED